MAAGTGPRRVIVTLASALLAAAVIVAGPSMAAARAQAAPPMLDEMTLAAEYAGYVDSVRGQKRYHVHYIRVATEAEARELIARLRSGGRFAEIARSRSTHAGSAAAGGDLGTHASCRWSRDTLAMLDSLKPGEIASRPVKGSSGWGVYRLETVQPLQPRSFDTYKRELLAGRFEPECPWQPPMAVGARPAPSP